MKLLALVGSYRRRGNTARIVRMIAAHLQETAAIRNEPLEIEVLNLGQMNIGVCRGCRVCLDQGEARCPLKDDLPALYAKMQAADGIIVASPVYMYDVSGTTKNWIDRLAYVSHRPQFAGKCAYLVATTGSTSTGHALKTLSMGLRAWGFHIVGQDGFTTGAYMPEEEIGARFGKRVARIADRLFTAIRQEDFRKPSLLSLLTFGVQQRYWSATGDTIDYAYWSGKGWTNPDREFYIPHRANRMKVAFARLAAPLVARFVT